MDLSAELDGARQRVLILGTSPIAEELLASVSELAEVVARPSFEDLTILYESDDELYKQSVVVGHASSSRPAFFADLVDARDYIQGIGARIVKEAGLPEERAGAVTVKQVTLRLPITALLVDDRLWVSFVADDLGSPSDYVEIGLDHPWRGRMERHLDFYVNATKGAIYLFDSEKDKQLIQMYDNGRPPKPRGDAPRKAFYDNNDIQRRSVWGFVFNSNGELVLHKRSEYTADNRAMWDKSFGGHVDTGEDSVTTAKRELIEEFFLAAAEDTLHLKEDVALVRSFGDWIAPSGAVGSLLTSRLKAAYEHLPKHSWALFVPQLKGESNRVIHTSKRYYTYPNGEWAWRNARFIADSFFLVAPKGFLLSSEDVDRSLAHGSEKGAAAKHRLVDVRSLLQELARTPLDSKEFTEDLYYFTENYRDDLLRFSNFVRRVFGSVD